MWDRWLEVFATLRRNKLRTLLTSLSVAWGIFILVILLGAGTGFQKHAEEQFRDDATNSLWAFGGRTSLPFHGHKPGREVQFTNDDYDVVKESLPEIEYMTGRFRMQGDHTVTYGDRTSSFQVRATHPEHKYLELTLLTAGRFLNEIDLSERRKVAVIGNKVAEFLFRNRDAIGEYIQINGTPFRVVGLFNDLGSEREPRTIYIPISTAQRADSGSDRVHQIMFTIGTATAAQSASSARAFRSLLAGRHNIAPNDRRAIRIRNNVEQFQEIVQMFARIRVFIWIVGFGTIIAGVVGVGNIMLISVKERTKEIGVRKALGATPGSLVSMILAEAMVLTSVAGYCGLVAGVGVVELARRYLPANDYLSKPEVDLGVAISATILLVVCGAVAGYFPARNAARVNPIVALRDE